MKTAVQPVKGPELEDKISQLRILSYPDFPEVHDVGYYSNLYRWYRDHPLSDELYRWVSVTEEGEVVGHLTAFPQFYRIDGQRVVAHTPGDYMVLPQHGFQAIMLMRSFFRADRELRGLRHGARGYRRRDAAGRRGRRRPAATRRS